MRANQFFTEENKDQDTVVEMFKLFFPLAMEVLGIDRLPKMNFEPLIDTGNQPSFGMYRTNDKTLYVALLYRHPVDVLRTVAHELVHFRQDLRGELNDQSGATGSPEENQAHEIAGVIMRYFNKKYPQFLRSKPIMPN